MPIATSQATVDTTSGGVVVVAARTGRQGLSIINHGTTAVYLGAPSGSLTTSNGALLAGVAGASVNINDYGGAIYGIVGSGSQVVSVLETY